MSQIEQIWIGFKNLIFKDEKIEIEAERRLKICFECPIRSGGICSKQKEYNGVKGCGCSLKMKSRSGSPCPLKNW